MGIFEGCGKAGLSPPVRPPRVTRITPPTALGLGLQKGKVRAEVSLPAQRPDGVSTAAAETAALLHRSEKERWFHGAHSPVYFGYTSQWGRLAPKQRETIEQALKRLVELSSTARKTGRDGGPRAAASKARCSRLSPPDPLLEIRLAPGRMVAGDQEAENALQSGDTHRTLEILAQAPARETLHTYAAG